VQCQYPVPRDDKINDAIINKHQYMPYPLQDTVQIDAIKDPQHEQKHFAQNEIQKIGCTINHKLQGMTK